MKVLVTGAAGQLGGDIVRVFRREGASCRGTERAELDLTDGGAVRRLMREFAPDAVVHCAAYTAVDRAETERERCYGDNVLATETLARSCGETGAALLYVSTDYVFDGTGTRPFEVTDAPRPVNYYGLTKYWGEQAVRRVTERYFIVRVSWVFGPRGRNFVSAMLERGQRGEAVAAADDQFGAPTYTEDAAALFLSLLNSRRYGTYHAANEGCCSRYELTLEAFREAGLEAPVTPVPSAFFPAPARRPLNSRLSMRSLAEGGFSLLPDYRDALKRYIRSLSGPAEKATTV